MAPRNQEFRKELGSRRADLLSLQRRLSSSQVDVVRRDSFRGRRNCGVQPELAAALSPRGLPRARSTDPATV